ncbi:MAG TPA: hypothetical protein DEP18_04905 [Flavobacteriales bacterium]|nr:hypothetical protein [Flavobacteriales bacterium]HCA83104.1 hypothetical protein [Flavobacteriales bacterium]HRE75743.1 SpoIIE family protein phosphatase [Flavobacteriales bacterium]HRE95951.1 SpoIIE family protein phosphatase [Flavobacteriales bacterium]HRJ34510.1 SpoIIE family protein phosphatase [Flavobacteriales bacterium]
MRRSSILRQLLINTLVPVVLVLLAVGVISYRINRQQLEESNRRLREQIVAQTKSILSIHDEALHILEEDLNDRIEMLSDRLLTEYFAKPDSLHTADLFRISAEIGMDTAIEHLYVINDSSVITNTTFAKDLGLDFSKIDTSFVNSFAKMRKEGNLVIDRFGEEMITGKIKKYSFLPTPDGRNIIEMGIYSAMADGLRDKAFKNVSEISANFPEIRNIASFATVANVKNVHLPDHHYEHYQRAMKEKVPVRVSESEDGIDHYYDYFFLDIQSSSIYTGYLLLIESDNSREKALIRAEVIRFSVLFLVTISLLSLVIYYRSRSIALPIRVLTDKARVIAGGKLDERVPIKGNNEITDLSQSFNTMIDDLEGMYVNLEKKVKERTHELNHQKELVEEKNKEITDSINYARRIQYALLAHDDLLKENLPEHFVLFMPKDIVSGDFYWACLHPRGNSNDFYLAVCDSTGHGVPGAFMSLLNISFLNEAINEKTIEEPGKILDHTRRRLIENISQQGQKDGMDGILVRFSEGKISFAAANNPPLIIRNGEEIELAADKMPIGQSDRIDPFTTVIPDLQKGDMFYLFTDGYPDQFGGPKGKKFKYRQLYDLLKEIAHLSMTEQRTILESTIENWKGDLEQVDDICVIGIRV